jgi:hypothetical protein
LTSDLRWVKRGRILIPDRQASWIGTHAALPVVQQLADRQRVYFSSRDDRNRSHIGFAELSLDREGADRTFAPAAVLSPGVLGAFDDAGVTSSCLVEHSNLQYLYYTGWALGVSVPFYLQAGLAISEDGGRHFRRLSDAPLLDRSDVDPLLTASPWVLIDGGVWRMWYVSGTSWRAAASGPEHFYHIRYAESRDGITWLRRGRVAIDFESPEEHAFGRPCVVKDGNLYRMWYSYRGDSYRIGYAESDDGIGWTRMDSVSVIDVSDQGWDAEMVTYPCVVRTSGAWWMLYNGNSYGRTGIGWATAE